MDWSARADLQHLPERASSLSFEDVTLVGKKNVCNVFLIVVTQERQNIPDKKQTTQCADQVCVASASCREQRVC